MTGAALRTRAVTGRADLLRALAALPGPEDQIATMLGFRPSPAAARPPPPDPEPAPGPTPATESPAPPPDIRAAALRQTPFWRADSLEARAPHPGPGEAPMTPPAWENRPLTPPILRLLAAWRDLAPRLRGAITARGPTADLDTDRVVAALCRGRPVDPLPRQTTRRLATHLHVIIDRSDRLIPFWDDQDVMIAILRRRIPPDRLSVSVIYEALSEPAPMDRDGRFEPPAPGGRVLVLGDLGALQPGDRRILDLWSRLGQRIARAGCAAGALIPVPLGRCPAGLRAHWTLVAWERTGVGAPQDEAARRARAERLLTLASPAARIEPGLLRALRRALPAGEADAGTEADVWSHPALISQSPLAATLDPAEARARRAAFADEPAKLQKAVLALLASWRHDLPDEIWFEEVLNLTDASLEHLPHREDADTARRFLEFLHASPGRLTGDARDVEQWLLRVDARATPAAWGREAFTRAVASARVAATGQGPDADIDPILVAGGETRAYEIRQVAGGLIARPSAPLGPPGPGSLVGVIRSANRLIRLDAANPAQSPWPPESGRPRIGIDEPPIPWPPGDRATLTTDREILTLVRETRPRWASGMGRDRFGLHADFTVPGTEVTQRMRWIPPGRFAMGSPDDEPGRHEVEGPVHEVTLTAGFWLFDTPCTQALWAAVMRDAAGDKARVAELVGKRGRWPNLEGMVNPSRFASPTRPVEQVSHDDLWVFIETLNGLVPGLDLTLPSEAEWEYACRAGAETATYAGAMEILGANNAPALDPIAWYGGNSGKDFDLPEGHNSSGWPDKQYDHGRAGTRPVAMKAPNAWGLYDMLGNVWEWCADTWHYNYVKAPNDGSAWIGGDQGGGAWRLVRGGSWGNDARLVRAAYRFRDLRDLRVGSIGFRCARVQSDSERERRAGRSKPGERSELAATTRPKRRGLSSIFQPRKGAPKAPNF